MFSNDFLAPNEYSIQQYVPGEQINRVIKEKGESTYYVNEYTKTTKTYQGLVLFRIYQLLS